MKPLQKSEPWSNEFGTGAKSHSPLSTPDNPRARPQLDNIVKTAIRIIAGSRPGEVARAAKIIGVSEPTLYRWRRAGNMAEARGAELLRVYELTGLPVELLIRG